MPWGQSIERARWGGMGAAVVVLSLLSGCLQAPETRGPALATATPSPLIAELQARHSVLPPHGPFDQLAAAILAANSGAAASQLRLAELKSQAKSQNWLPQLGPSVSLSSLSGLVASLTLTAPVIDNGRRKAERDFAAADVEVAAVALSVAMNQRVFEGLTAYIQAQQAQAQAAVSQDAVGRLSDFEAAMQTRVQGGLSDMSEQQVISQRRAEMQATVAADQDSARAALAQVAALVGRDVTGLSGMDALPILTSGPTPLAVLRQRGEGRRSLAGASLARADMLPGLTASADAHAAGVNPGLRLTGLGMLNPGAGATMQAIAETTTLVNAQNAEAADTANRRLVSLSGEITTLQGRAAQGAQVLAQTEANLELFTEQYRQGGASLLELVSQYDAFARLKRDQVSLRFDIALRQLEMARDLGLLVEGAKL